MHNLTRREWRWPTDLVEKVLGTPSAEVSSLISMGIGSSRII